MGEELEEAGVEDEQEEEGEEELVVVVVGENEQYLHLNNRNRYPS